MSTFIQLLGMAAITFGVSLMSVTAGLIVGGVFLLLAGVSMGRK